MAFSRAEITARYRARHPEKIAAYKASPSFAERDIAWRAFNRERINTNARAWWAKNREKMLALRRARYDAQKNNQRGKDYYQKNKQKKLAANKAWRDANAEKCRQLHQDWIERHREHYLARSTDYAAERRAISKCATPAWADRKAIRAIYAQAKALTKSTGILHHVDHIIPLQSDVVCGLHVERNLRVVPYAENISKGNKLIF